jgi:hypothetical protein
MDTLDHQITGTRFHLTFNSNLLTDPQVTLGSVFDSQINFNSPMIESDSVEVALARNPGTPPFDQGQVTVATITFTPSPTASGTAQLTFDEQQTEIYDVNTVDLLESTSPAMVTF